LYFSFSIGLSYRLTEHRISAQQKAFFVSHNRAVLPANTSFTQAGLFHLCSFPPSLDKIATA
jgi:hypothetical protein